MYTQPFHFQRSINAVPSHQAQRTFFSTCYGVLNGNDKTNKYKRHHILTAQMKQNGKTDIMVFILSFFFQASGHYIIGDQLIT